MNAPLPIQKTTAVPTEQQRWEGLMRGQVMSATTNKFSVILRMLDQKAQVMILLNSFIVPVCLQSMHNGQFQGAAVISILAAVLSIWAAIICIYPKRKYRSNGDRGLNLLHYNDIGHMEQQDFFDQIIPKFNDISQLAELVAHDLYDTARYSIVPKFVWLKISYAIFGIGNLCAIGFVLFELYRDGYGF